MYYPLANRRKCYWRCPDCLKKHDRCSPGCTDYISVAQVRKRQLKEQGLKER